MAFIATLVYPHTFWYRWRQRNSLWRTRAFYTLRSRAGASPITVALAKAAGQADPTAASPINFTVTFDRAVTGFTNQALYPGGTTAPGNYTTVITGGPAVYNVAMQGMTGGAGNVGIGINAGFASDGAGNTNLASVPPQVVVAYTG
jgi:hypothetical protein